jgi:hypothetical protein
VEVYTALTSGMITLLPAGAMVIGISSVYRKSGLLYDKIAAHLGQSGDDVLAIQAPSATFNPTLADEPAASEIAAALVRDPERASAEWLSVWRSDLSDLFDRETVQQAVDPGVTIRWPRPGTRYLLAVDPSGGRADSFTAAVGHRDGELLIVDRIYEKRAPFVADVALDEIAEIARDYRVGTAYGDDYGAGLTVSAFRQRGIDYRPIAIHDKGSEDKVSRTEIYLNALTLFTSGRVRLPDNPRLFEQLISLERRTQRSGHDTVDHPAGQHDDVANAVCACLVALAGAKRRMVVNPEALALSRTGVRLGSGQQHSPETVEMARLAGIPIDVDTTPDGRRRPISQTALAVSRWRMTSPRPDYGDPNRGSIDQFAIAQMLRGGRR